MADFQIRMEACPSSSSYLEKEKSTSRNNDFPSSSPPPTTSSSLLDLSEKGIASEEEVLKHASAAVATTEEWARVKYLHLDGNRLTQVPRYCTYTYLPMW